MSARHFESEDSCGSLDSRMLEVQGWCASQPSIQRLGRCDGMRSAAAGAKHFDLLLRAMKARRALAVTSHRGPGCCGRVGGAPIGSCQSSRHWSRRAQGRSRAAELAVLLRNPELMDAMRTPSATAAAPVRSHWCARRQRRALSFGRGQQAPLVPDRGAGQRLLLIRPDGDIFGGARDANSAQQLLAPLCDQLHLKNSELV